MLPLNFPFMLTNYPYHVFTSGRKTIYNICIWPVEIIDINIINKDIVFQYQCILFMMTYISASTAWFKLFGWFHEWNVFLRGLYWLFKSHNKPCMLVVPYRVRNADQLLTIDRCALIIHYRTCMHGDYRLAEECGTRPCVIGPLSFLMSPFLSVNITLSPPYTVLTC